MYPTNMNLPCQLKTLICLWTLMVFMSGINCLDGRGGHLSMEDVLLLKHEPDPKCFTKMWNKTDLDFTCFFESPDNRTYDFFDEACSQRWCNTFVQRTKEETFLHICSFPRSKIMLFVDITLNVVDRNSNATLFNRTVTVEDNVIVHQPISVSLNQNGHAGQLQASWNVNTSCIYEKHYKIQYMSETIGVKTKQGEEKWDETLMGLVPGEEVEARVMVKCANSEDTGHWSHWSDPVKAKVPQTADDISLMCYTSDLYNITCQWDGSRYSAETPYKLFYKMVLSDSEALGWTNWTECLPRRDVTDLCCFHGDMSKKVKVKLTSSPSPYSRTFYSEKFALAQNIKTPPPNYVKIVPEKAKMCMNWEAPLPSVSDHLLYELSYKRGVQEWMTVSMKKNATCTEVPSGSRISIKVRAKPDGVVYSGHWSEWTDVYTKDAPIDISTLLVQCSPVMLLVIAVIIFYLFVTYYRKLKQIFWPPVPNLDKILQDFLADINGQKWDPPITAKQCFEEITSSIVEVSSKDEHSEMSSEVSTELLPTPETLLSSGEQMDGGLTTETEIFPDYVTLNRDNEILRPQENSYVYKQVEEKEGPEVTDEVFKMTTHCSCTDESAGTEPCLCPVFLNHSYLPVTPDHIDCKVTDSRGTGNIYTNLPCS